MLFWTVYNGSIIYIGVRSRRKNDNIVRVKNKEFPKFSIIVPTKDEEIVISRCLNGILKLDYPKDKMEIIVVDGNSATQPAKYAQNLADKYPAYIKIVNEKESKR